MTRFLLDTTALIDFSKGREPAFSKIAQMISLGNELGVCAVNIAEFYSGIPQDKYPVWNEFFASLRYWEITRTAAQLAGQYRHEFAQNGKAISTTDTLIAAVARENDATIVTDNVKDYPMEDISLLALRNYP